MNNPVRVQAEISEFERILGIWEECAEDLLAAVDAEYPDRDKHPVQSRRHKRDSEVARLSLSMIPALRLKYDVEKYER